MLSEESQEPYGREANEPLCIVPQLPELPKTVLPETGLGEACEEKTET